MTMTTETAMEEKSAAGVVMTSKTPKYAFWKSPDAKEIAALMERGITPETNRVAFARKKTAWPEARNAEVDKIWAATGRYPKNITDWDSPPDSIPDSAQIRQSLPEIELPAMAKTDWSDAVLNGRLGEICQRRMNRFPIAYAWPSLIAAAGVTVPPIMPTTGITIADDNVNSFTGLVGPVHSGKSQAIEWAYKTLGLPDNSYSDIKAGSSELLLTKLSGMRTKGMLAQSLLIDLNK